jgi:hypothetical protein
VARFVCRRGEGKHIAWREAKGFVHVGFYLASAPNVKLAHSDLRVRLGQIAIKLQRPLTLNNAQSDAVAPSRYLAACRILIAIGALRTPACPPGPRSRSCP